MLYVWKSYTIIWKCQYEEKVKFFTRNFLPRIATPQVSTPYRKLWQLLRTPSQWNTDTQCHIFFRLSSTLYNSFDPFVNDKSLKLSTIQFFFPFFFFYFFNSVSFSTMLIFCIFHVKRQENMSVPIVEPHMSWRGVYDFD